MADIAFPTAKVVFRAAAIAQDSDDSGSIPQEILLGGIRVTLIPALKYVEVAAPPGGVNPTTYSLRTWNLITTNDGNLINMDDPEEEVLIVASDAFPGYVVSWKSIIEDPSETLPPIVKKWLAPAGSIVDLTTVISVPNNPNPIADYLQAVYDAREARDNAISSSQAASSSAREAQTALDAIPGTITDQVNTQVVPKITEATTALAAIPGTITDQVNTQVVPQVTEAKMAKNDAVAAKNDAVAAKNDAVAAKNAIGALPEFDPGLGEYPADLLQLWLARFRDGKAYGVDIPKGLSTACAKLGANAGIPVPIPGTNAVAAVDAYAQRGPFAYFEVNGFITPDGAPHVTAIMGDGRFARDGSAGDVWILAPVLYWRWVNLPDSVQLWISDTRLAGYVPQPKAYLPDGAKRPFMLYAKYGMSVLNGVPRSISGQIVETRTISHNSLRTICKNATSGYSGKSYADKWYVETVGFLLKYATKNSQSIFGLCSAHTDQAAPAIGESSTTRVVWANARAANIPIGSSMQLGIGTDRQTSTQRFANRKVIGKEPYDAANTALIFAGAPFTTDLTLTLSTTVWQTGACDLVQGDGSPTNRLSNREPAVIQGIEIGYGAHEILGDAILSSDGATGWWVYTLLDSQLAAISLTANYRKGVEVYSDAVEGWKYPPSLGSSDGLLHGVGSGASTSTGTCDATFVNLRTSVGQRASMSLGHLGGGGNAGLWCVLGGLSLGNAWWDSASRLSGLGRGGEAP